MSKFLLSNLKVLLNLKDSFREVLETFKLKIFDVSKKANSNLGPLAKWAIISWPFKWFTIKMKWLQLDWFWFISRKRMVTSVREVLVEDQKCFSLLPFKCIEFCMFCKRREFRIFQNGRRDWNEILKFEFLCWKCSESLAIRWTAHRLLQANGRPFNF